MKKFIIGFMCVILLSCHPVAASFASVPEGQVVPTNKHRRSIYHLHDVTHPEHYWLDQYDDYDLEKAVNFFVNSQKELLNIR